MTYVLIRLLGAPLKNIPQPKNQKSKIISQSHLTDTPILQLHGGTNFLSSQYHQQPNRFQCISKFKINVQLIPSLRFRHPWTRLQLHRCGSPKSSMEFLLLEDSANKSLISTRNMCALLKYRTSNCDSAVTFPRLATS